MKISLELLCKRSLTKQNKNPLNRGNDQHLISPYNNLLIQT